MHHNILSDIREKKRGKKTGLLPHPSTENQIIFSNTIGNQKNSINLEKLTAVSRLEEKKN